MTTTGRRPGTKLPELTSIPFGSLTGRKDRNVIPFHEAISCSDCFVDTDVITPRYGSISALIGAVVGSGTSQHLGRFQPVQTSARTIVVVGGKVYILTDPSSDAASDAVATLLGTPFSGTDTISGVALGYAYYLSTDNASNSWVRIKYNPSGDTYTLETLAAIPTPVNVRNSTSGTVTWTKFKDTTTTANACRVQTNSNTGFTGMNADWRGVIRGGAAHTTDNANDAPLASEGAYVQFKLAADFDATAYDWVAIAVSPHDGTGGNGYGTPDQVTVQVGIDSAGSPVTPFTDIGTTYDCPPIADSPSVIICDLRLLSAAVRSKIRYFRLTLTGSNGNTFIYYGFMFLPSPPVENPGVFYVDLYDPSTGQFSTLTDAVKVTIPGATLQQYPESRMGNDVGKSTGGMLGPLDSSNQEIFNTQSPTVMPTPKITDIGSTVTITADAPAFTQTSLTMRLWEDTENGRRLVTSVTGVTSGQTNVSLVAPGGVGVLANQLYIAGGTPPPRATSLTAHAQRLIAIYNQRVYISSYVPTSTPLVSWPYPQWPDIAIEDSDGWSFDIAPSAEEIGRHVNGRGDALYLITNEAWYLMSDLRPNSPVFQVMRRGTVGPFAVGFFEDRLFVAAWDGVYMGVGRASPIEMTETVKGTYQDLNPDKNMCLGYCPFTRSLYVFQGNQYLRYNFPTTTDPGRWSTGTLPRAVLFAITASRTTTVEKPQFWVLTELREVLRYQPSQVKDAVRGADNTNGVSIPAWVYSTGYDVSHTPQIVNGLMIDATGEVKVTLAKDNDALIPDQARQFTVMSSADVDEVWVPGAADFRGQKMRVQFQAPSNVTLRRAMWERSIIEAKGG